jgi:hypothetical protein
MARQGHPAAERLRAYLRQLKPGARALLISELERGLLHDTSPAGAEMVLAELRRSLREGSVRITRFDDNARLFFHPLEPFLVDDGPDHRHRGRIARTTLEPIWLWINNTLMPEDARAYALLVDAAMLAGDSERAEHAAHEFHDRVAPRIRQLLETATDRDRGRLSVQLGTVRAVDDVKTVCEILSGRDSLASIGMQLPGHIDSFGGLILDIVQKQLDDTLGSRSDLLVYALVLVMERLAAPWQLIRLATKVAGGGDVKRMAETPYGAAIDIVIEEVDRRIRELAGDLKSGRGIAVSALLKEIHDALRGLRSELDLSPESSWGHQLAVLHAKIARLLSGEIDMMPGRVRRLMRPRPSKEIAPHSRIDPHEVEETEALIVFVLTCRKYASELAINEVTQRTVGELQHLLDSGTRSLLDALRHAAIHEKMFRLSQVDAAVRFCAKVFGQEYAALLAKAAEVASHDEHKAANA